MAKKAKTKIALTGTDEMKELLNKIEGSGSLTKEERAKLQRYQSELESIVLQTQAHTVRLTFAITNFKLRERKSPKKKEGDLFGPNTQADPSNIDQNGGSGKENESEGTEINIDI